MTNTQQDRITLFLTDIQSVAPEQVEIIHLVRHLFHESHRGLTEDIKYGGLVFFRSGSLIGGVFPYKKHLSIEFSHGADFKDASGLLEGKGKRRRHLKIYDVSDIEEKKAKYFIKQAVHT
jgi:hypothetical protein